MQEGPETPHRFGNEMFQSTANEEEDNKTTDKASIFFISMSSHVDYCWVLWVLNNVCS